MYGISKAKFIHERCTMDPINAEAEKNLLTHIFKTISAQGGGLTLLIPALGR